MSFENKNNQINQLRFKLRNELIEKMKTNPTMKDSETLRLVENDISFWQQQIISSPLNLFTLLNKSFKRT